MQMTRNLYCNVTSLVPILTRHGALERLKEIVSPSERNIIPRENIDFISQKITNNGIRNVTLADFKV